MPLLKRDKKIDYKEKIFFLIMGIFLILGLYFFKSFLAEKSNVILRANNNAEISAKYNVPILEKNEVKIEEQIENIDWNKIQSENDSIKAWISIPGTKINYPILQSSDNDYFLSYNSDKVYDPYGSIFMDYRQPFNLSSENTFIYGHNVAADELNPMFGELTQYEDEEFFNSHKDIIIYTPEKVYKGTVFAAHVDSAKSDSYIMNYGDNNEFKSHVEFMKNKSIVSTDFDINQVDKMITLWTCANEETIDSKGNYVPVDKSRMFVSVSIK